MTTGVSLSAVATSSAEKRGKSGVIGIVHAGLRLRLVRIDGSSISDYRRVCSGGESRDDVNMDSDVSSISMSINNGVLTQLLSIQQLPTQSRFKSHS
jgi:hypothetical protein